MRVFECVKFRERLSLFLKMKLTDFCFRWCWKGGCWELVFLFNCWFCNACNICRILIKVFNLFVCLCWYSIYEIRWHVYFFSTITMITRVNEQTWYYFLDLSSLKIRFLFFFSFFFLDNLITWINILIKGRNYTDTINVIYVY